MISVAFLVFIALVWTEYKIYKDYVKAIFIEDIEAKQEKNQGCFMTHKEGMKTLIIIGIVSIITLLYFFTVELMGLPHLLVILNTIIIGILMGNVIPFIYIWRSPKIIVFIKKNYFNIRTIRTY